MPCKKCDSGIRECGPDAGTLCELGGDPPKTVATVCHDVFVRKNPATGECQVSVDHGWTETKVMPPPVVEKYRVCVEIRLRQDSKGNCVVGFDLKTEG